MVEIRLYAIGIDEVRDWFGAGSETAATLRGITAERFWAPLAEHRPPSGGMLAKLGPLFRHDPWAPRLPLGLPTPNDVEQLITGRFVAPDGLSRAWTVMRVWLEELSWGHLVLALADSEWRALEFDLARAGVPSQFAISKLWGLDPALPLGAEPGTSIGYAKHHHAVATADHLRAVAHRVGGNSRDPVRQVVDFLETLSGWNAAAAAAGRPTPDVVGSWRGS